MGNPLLSICVPNYNQGRALEATLECLATIAGHDRIEILISDNGSNEIKSMEVIKELQDADTSIKVLTGATKIEANSTWFGGFGANLIRLANKAEGDYVWFLGCGDLPNLQFLSGILDLLGEQTYENILLIGEVYSSDLARTIDSNLGHQRINLQVYNTDTSDKIPFDLSISCNITRRTVFMQNNTNFKFLDSWPHVEFFLNYFSNETAMKWAIILDSTIKIDQPPDGWFSKIEAIDIYLNLLSLYDRIVKSKVYRNFYESVNSSMHVLKIAAFIMHLRETSKDCAKVSPSIKYQAFHNFNYPSIAYLWLCLKIPFEFLLVFRRFNQLIIRILGK